MGVGKTVPELSLDIYPKCPKQPLQSVKNMQVSSLQSSKNSMKKKS